MKKFLTTTLIAASLVGSAAGIASAGTQEQNTAAAQRFSANVGVGTTVGALTGTAFGAAIGCIIGGGLTAPTVVFIPVGCLTGAVTGAGIGGVVGTLLVGGPTAVVEGVQYVTVLLTPAV